MKRNCDFMSQHFETTGNKFLVGSKHLTIADLLIICELDQLGKEAFDLFDYTPHPLVEKYMENVRSSLTSYKDNFQPVVDAAEKFKEMKK